MVGLTPSGQLSQGAIVLRPERVILNSIPK